MAPFHGGNRRGAGRARTDDYQIMSPFSLVCRATEGDFKRLSSLMQARKHRMQRTGQDYIEPMGPNTSGSRTGSKITTEAHAAERSDFRHLLQASKH